MELNRVYDKRELRLTVEEMLHRLRASTERRDLPGSILDYADSPNDNHKKFS